MSDVIKIWDIIHVRNVGELGFCDLEKAIGEVVGMENDIASCVENNQTSPKTDGPS